MQTIQRLAAAAVTTLALAGTLPVAQAQTSTSTAYPSRPVTLVVPFAAGGATDMLARVMAHALEAQAGQTFVVENVGGAGATIGTARVANAAPDGNTLLLGSSSALVMAPHLYNNLTYDPFTSFEPIGPIASAPYVLVTSANSPYKSYEQLLQAARDRPGTLNYGTPGAGSSLHLTLELMLDSAGVQATHIPYRGSAPVWTALLGGDLDFMIDTPSAVLPMLEGGRATALAVTSRERLPQLPNVPTLNELGLKDFESQAWFALLAPKGTPPAVVARLEDMLAQASRDPGMLETLKKAQFTPAGPVEGGLAGQIRREYDRWGGVIRDRNIQLN